MIKAETIKILKINLSLFFSNSILFIIVKERPRPRETRYSYKSNISKLETYPISRIFRLFWPFPYPINYLLKFAIIESNEAFNWLQASSSLAGLTEFQERIAFL